MFENAPDKEVEARWIEIVNVQRCCDVWQKSSLILLDFSSQSKNESAPNLVFFASTYQN